MDKVWEEALTESEGATIESEGATIELEAGAVILLVKPSLGLVAVTVEFDCVRRDVAVSGTVVALSPPDWCRVTGVENLRSLGIGEGSRARSLGPSSNGGSVSSSSGFCTSAAISATRPLDLRGLSPGPLSNTSSVRGVSCCIVVCDVGEVQMYDGSGWSSWKVEYPEMWSCAVILYISLSP